jgi:hypothetical protein
MDVVQRTVPRGDEMFHSIILVPGGKKPMYFHVTSTR